MLLQTLPILLILNSAPPLHKEFNLQNKLFLMKLEKLNSFVSKPISSFGGEVGGVKMWW